MRTIEPIAKFDFAFSQFCLRHRFSLPFARVSQAISHTGDGHLYAVIGLLAWLIDGTLGLMFLLTGLLSFALELPLYWASKNLFKRRRPQELSELLPSFITPSDRYSLPSGHTAAAFLMANLLGHFYPDTQILALSWASLIATARILLGVHFFTDVLIGALLGMSCATSAIAIMGA